MNIAALKATLTGTLVTGGTISGVVYYYEPSLVTVWNHNVSIFVKHGVVVKFDSDTPDIETKNKTNFCSFDDVNVSREVFECTVYATTETNTDTTKTENIDQFTHVIYQEQEFKKDNYYKIDVHKNFWKIWSKNPTTNVNFSTNQNITSKKESFTPLFAITADNKVLEFGTKKAQKYIIGKARQITPEFKPLAEYQEVYSTKVHNEIGYLCSSALNGPYIDCKVYDFEDKKLDGTLKQFHINEETNIVEMGKYYKVVGEKLKYDPIYIKQNVPNPKSDEDYEDEVADIEIIKLENLKLSGVFGDVLFVFPN